MKNSTLICAQLSMCAVSTSGNTLQHTATHCSTLRPVTEVRALVSRPVDQALKFSLRLGVAAWARDPATVGERSCHKSWRTSQRLGRWAAPRYCNIWRLRRHRNSVYTHTHTHIHSSTGTYTEMRMIRTAFGNVLQCVAVCCSVL